MERGGAVWSGAAKGGAKGGARLNPALRTAEVDQLIVAPGHGVLRLGALVRQKGVEADLARVDVA